MLQRRGPSDKITRSPTFYFNTLDIATIAIFACLTGVFSAYIASLNIFLGLTGFWYEQIFQGLYMVWLIIAAYLVRKPGAGVVTGAISGLIEFLAGNPLGVIIIPYGFFEGLGVDIGFSLFRYKRFDKVAFFTAGSMWVLTIFYTIYAFGIEWMPLTTPILWLLFGISQILTGGILGGLVAKIIAKVLDKSRLTERYIAVSRGLDRRKAA
jgi:energy-coupling factor transport system substrate-specific component